MTWRNLYDARKIGVTDAAALVQSNSLIALGTQCAEPQSLVEHLVGRHRELENVELIGSVMGSPCPYAQPEMKGSFTFKTFLGSKATVAGMKAGVVDYIPVHLSQIAQLFQDGFFKPDIAMIQVAPPDEDGYCSLGLSVDYLPDAIRAARVVVAEVNDRMPYTLGETKLHVSQIDHIVCVSQPVLTLPPINSGPAERVIASYVATLVPDGATVEVGMGSAPLAAAKNLAEKKELRLHTGLLSDWVLDLVAAECLEKSHPVIATIIAGSQKLYDFVDRNSRIQLHPSKYTHSATVLAGLRNFVAINSALEVDLTGQVNTEGIGKNHLAGTGGLADFSTAANCGARAINIIAMPSTSASGQSRLVAQLSCAGGVSVARADARYVVTEYGIADLRGKSLRERASLLIAIGHPDFRAQLAHEFEYALSAQS
jgi:4-hydroxybutyrate CoA-transferase